MTQTNNKTFYARNALLAALVVGAAGAAWIMLAPDGQQATEDAYVDGNVVQLTPQVSGSVTEVGADNTEFVRAGQVLVQLNPVDARLALARAEAQLSKAVRQVRAQFANAGQFRANVALRAADLARAEADLARRRGLADSGAISGEDIHHAEDAVKTARAALDVAGQQLAGAGALVDQTGVGSHPEVLAAVAQLREAYIASARTTLRAPVSGLVAKRNVQLGQRVNAGTALMAIVPPEQMWVNANFKESQLREIRIGQPVVLSADVYGKAVRYSGRVIGQDAGTGSAFALLPAQNATGNWIKVVQRVPIRIALDPAQLAAHPLKLGLSMHVAVDIADRSGAVAMRTVSTRPAYATDVFDRELDQADQLAERIVAANSGIAIPAGGGGGAGREGASVGGHDRAAARNN
ncbi:HlyD family efflux transporter periplasmic adaptor subunit [Duganella aceris]|uniref:HlyD family efflux transporter periplasmic adaptor subunit n=1 Tax=Duganella aceris TaxID=2703883 RepID=A0ABX0FF22_9BURK|nr:HlyD family efflux transporter periplasmic adaptor subunit [Duganella aceris]NGZ83135.1 HlyD family efflux transporter periplasmic adaptor subunit [Duganella aceris]